MAFVAFSTASVAPSSRSRLAVVAKAAKTPDTSRRDFVLNSVNAAVLGALFNIGAAPRPSQLGVIDYGGGVKTLAEEANDLKHYVPAWNYAPQDGRGRKGAVPQEKAMAELADVVSSLTPDNFTPKIVKQTQDYLYVEYTSPTFGFVDDVEFWFPSDRPNTCEYRSASRIGESDGDVNRKRIKAIRQALEKKGWESVGF